MTCEVTNTPMVRLLLPSRAESLTLARSMVAGLAEGAGLGERHLNAMRTTISEASNNVVAHAYGDDSGPLSISVAVLSGGVDVLVQDRGGGIRRVVPASDRMGLGLAVISSLADRAEFVRRPGGGTEVHMFFRDVGAPEDGFPSSAGRHLDEPVALGGDVVASVSPASLTAHVLGRLSRAVASQSRFSVARISDLREITAALASSMVTAGICPIWFSLDASSRRLELRIGPLDRGAAMQVGQTAATPAGVSLADLVDDLAVDQSGVHEFLRAVVIDKRERNCP